MKIIMLFLAFVLGFFSSAKKSMKQLILAAVTIGSLFITSVAYAAIDVTDALAGILEAQVAILAIIGALIVMATVLFGVTMVYRFLRRRSGV